MSHETLSAWRNPPLAGPEGPRWMMMLRGGGLTYDVLVDVLLGEGASQAQSGLGVPVLPAALRGRLQQVLKLVGLPAGREGPHVTTGWAPGPSI